MDEAPGLPTPEVPIAKVENRSIPGPDGSLRLLGVIKLLLRRPWAIPRLYALRSRSARAAASLAAFVAGTLRRLEGTGKDA